MAAKYTDHLPAMPAKNQLSPADKLVPPDPRPSARSRLDEQEEVLPVDTSIVAEAEKGTARIGLGKQNFRGSLFGNNNEISSKKSLQSRKNLGSPPRAHGLQSSKNFCPMTARTPQISTSMKKAPLSLRPLFQARCSPSHQSGMRRSSIRLVLGLLALLLGTSPLINAQLILPTAITVSVPDGSNNPASPGFTNPYTDDVYLASLTFPGGSLNSSSGQFATIQSAYVDSGRGNTNAEWGDNDDNSDGNPDPFTRVGIDAFNLDGSVNTNVQESTDPAIQDIGLASVFSSLSLTEITDGESEGSTTNFIFSNGITDNNNAGDDLPEIVLFERGNNDTTTVRAITGGTFANPDLAGTAVTISSGAMWNTDIWIDTTEIDAIQQLAAGGIDLNAFGITDGTPVYGIQIETTGGDFGGFVQTAVDPQVQFSDVPAGLLNPQATVIPEPSSQLFFALLVSTSCLLRRHRR